MTRTFRVALLTSTLLAGQAMAETTLTRLCCTNPMRDSSRESSMVAVWYE